MSLSQKYYVVYFNLAIIIKIILFSFNNAKNYTEWLRPLIYLINNLAIDTF
jgi:hypothetical protein